MENSEARKRRGMPPGPEEVLRNAVEDLVTARQRYLLAIENGVKAGLTNRKMGQIAGVTEGAIRMYRKRKGI